ncbi:MAG: hypothetical protein ACRC7N_17035 [Clostridium sp.]
MLKQINKLKFQIGSIGGGIYIPLLVFLFIFVYVIVLAFNGYEINKVVNIIELFIPVFSCWWSIFYISSIYEEVGQIFLTYPISGIKLILVPIIKYLVLYMILTILLLLEVFIIYNELDYKYVFLIISQCLYYFSLSYALMAILNDKGWAIFLSFSYLFVVFLTKGTFLSLYNVHNFGNYEGAKSIFSIKAIIFGTILFLIAQYIFNRKSKFGKVQKGEKL